jgi:hypothetical protein
MEASKQGMTAMPTVYDVILSDRNLTQSKYEIRSINRVVGLILF